ncbi:MAG: methyltransferase domain-containing protein [Deinococcota bacterium]
MLGYDTSYKLADVHELEDYLAKLHNLFDTDALLQAPTNEDDVVDYYQQSFNGYRHVHSSFGAVHMGFTEDGAFNERDYYGQAKHIAAHIDTLQQAAQPITAVLELASGQGVNSNYLAERYPDVSFTGIDLTPKHLKVAEGFAAKRANLNFVKGNFQDMPFAEASFDVVFEVESICYATNMAKAVAEIYRVLRPGGVAVLFDGFRLTSAKSVSAALKQANELVEAAMTIDAFWELTDWLELVRAQGFTVLQLEDYFEKVLPTLARLQTLARFFIDTPMLRVVLPKVLPPKLLQNAIAGLLMPFTIQAGTQAYYYIVLQKPQLDDA